MICIEVLAWHCVPLFLCSGNVYVCVCVCVNVVLVYMLKYCSDNDLLDFL